MPSAVTELVTQRLRLRPVVPDDLEPLAAIWTDPLVMRHMSGRTRTAAERRDRIRELMEHQRQHGFGKWTVVERATDEAIGYCGIELYEGGPDVELGFCLARSAWGRGYATEAARASLEHGLAAIGFERVLAVVDPANRASMRVLEKLRLTCLGPTMVEGREWLLYEARRQSS